MDAAGALDVEEPSGERRAGAAGADERVRAALGDGARGLHDRRLAASRGPRARDRRSSRSRPARRHLDSWRQMRGGDLGGGAEQQYARALFGGEGGARGDLRGPEVGAVGVDGDDDVATRGRVRRARRVRAGATISRPAYVPQTAQTRCGRRGEWQRGHSLSAGAVTLCWARRLAVRLWDCFFLGTAISAGKGSSSGPRPARPASGHRWRALVTPGAARVAWPSAGRARTRGGARVRPR